MTGSRMARAAQYYAGKLGWKVFPLAPRSKVPAIKGGRGCLDASDDPDQILEWWAATPDANVGLATGPASGFWVLDVDPRSGGDISLDQLTQSNGSLPDTVLGLTGGGGQHFLFQLHVSLDAIKWKSIAQGLDAKGHNGYIVAPPSVHPETGREYAWESSSRPGELEIAQSPVWLLHLLWRARMRRHGTDTAASAPRSCDPTSFLLGKVFADHGWLGPEFKPGVWAVMCPSRQLHSTGRDYDTSTVLFAPSEGKSVGWFYCSHSHCQEIFVTYADVARALQRQERIPS